MQEVRKSQNRDLRADPAWSINSGEMESNPGDFPGFRHLRAAASSSGLKGSGCRTMMKALFLKDSCSMTEMLFAVSHPVFTWSMLGRVSSSAAFLLPHPEKGV